MGFGDENVGSGCFLLLAMFGVYKEEDSMSFMVALIPRKGKV